VNANWAAENLQTIRTLMERSALYRRALAPVMMLTGGVGVAAGLVGGLTQCDSPGRFIRFWFAVAAATLTGALVVIRRQALRDKEPFWSPPTRRVAQAMLPALLIGLLAGLALLFAGAGFRATWALVPLWLALHGAGLNAAGFFMPRGIKALGWAFIAAGTLILLPILIWPERMEFRLTHWAMGAAFGGLHLAYGLYLRFTEKPDAP